MQINLNGSEKMFVLSLLQGKLADLGARLEHYRLLDQYDKDQFPKQIEEAIGNEMEIIKNVIPKLKEQLKN